MTVIELKKQERNIETEVNNKIYDDMTEKRYFVAELIKKALDKYLDFDDMAANNSLSIYALPIINRELNIIDFEINKLSVGIVATIDKGKNQNVYIPQSYKQLHYKPDMLLFVNFTKTFAKMEILGYITDINFQKTTIPKNSLLSADNLIDALLNTKPKEKNVPSNIINTTEELMLAYIDNDLSDEGKRFFLKHLLEYKEIRKNYKLFYAMSCDFISIAKTREIEKINPEDEKNKIDLQSRSDYLTDKAIEKYNTDENIVIDDEIEQSLLADFELKNAETLTNFAENENILEFSLDDLTNDDNLNSVEDNFETDNEEPEQDIQEEIVTDEQAEILQEAPEAQEEEPEIENDINADLQVDEIESIEQEINFNDDNSEYELSLADDEVIDLSEAGFDDSLQNNHGFDIQNEEYQSIIEEVNTDTNTEPEIETISAEQPEDIEAVIDVSETEPNAELLEDINDDELEEILNNTPDENSSLPDNEATIQQEEIQAEDLTDITEDDDLFAFLSDIADEEQPATLIQEESIPQEQTETFTAQNQAEYTQIPDENTESNISPHITEQPQENQEIPNNNIYVQPQPKKTSNSRTLLLGLMLTVALGTGFVLTHKDEITSKLHLGQKTDDIQGLALDNQGEIPPPVSDGTSTNNTQDTGAVAPAPTTNNTADTTKQIPPAQNAPTLPALPTTTVEPPKAKHMNDAIANALTKDFNGVRISKVSWEASETLVNNPDVKRYLTIAGKSIKNSLSQDLISATEPSFKDNVVVTITYRKDGSVSKTDITGSSGSAQIDDIVKKSVDNTLKYVKMPSMNLATPEYTAKLIIRL